MERAKQLMEERNLTEVTRPLDLKIAVPLLQGAAFEEDKYLQNLWAKMLCNAIDDRCIEIRRVYIDILERISPLEAKIIDKIYSQQFDEIGHKSLLTYNLPESIEVLKDFNQTEPPITNIELKLALINLARNGCIKRTIGGGEIYTSINATLLGKYFYDACTT